MEKALRYSAMEDAPPPVITTAPHPRELARGLQARQLEGETCGFFEADPGPCETSASMAVNADVVSIDFRDCGDLQSRLPLCPQHHFGCSVLLCEY